MTSSDSASLNVSASTDDVMTGACDALLLLSRVSTDVMAVTSMGARSQMSTASLKRSESIHNRGIKFRNRSQKWNNWSQTGANATDSAGTSSLITVELLHKV